MFHLLASLVAVPTSASPDMSWLGPTVTPVGTVMVATVGGISLVWRRRQDRKEAMIDKSIDAEIAVSPTITDGWEEVRQARMEASNYYNLYRTFEDLFYTVLSALRHLARSVRSAHPDQQFDKDVVDALAVVPPDTTDAKK